MSQGKLPKSKGVTVRGKTSLSNTTHGFLPHWNLICVLTRNDCLKEQDSKNVQGQINTYLKKDPMCGVINFGFHAKTIVALSLFQQIKP